LPPAESFLAVNIREELFSSRILAGWIKVEGQEKDILSVLSGLRGPDRGGF